MAWGWIGHRKERRDKIASLLWRGFGHDRHGGPFSPDGDTPALEMTLQAADRALAAALKPEEMDLGMMGKLFDDITAHMHAGRWDYLNEALEARDPFLMSDAEITTYARTMLPGREHLSAWGPFVERAWVACGMRGSTDMSFNGLIDETGKATT